ncbi:MAG: class I SAM-dependent methyltransferase family protein [Candidatus Micrarchaeota archaeon]|nr:class I SAM-dependent methyltransferase family protein [Candidatus Micrarchaeota archaeon]MCX8154481.1 class I SAM-dependent methyltransferase family protein [Candidatus Micrarchaeota archaeon]
MVIILRIRDITGIPITSYDIIGDKAVVYIPDEYMDRAREIAEAIVKVHKRVKSVFRKNPVEGEYRTRRLEHIYGDPGTETITRENGIILKLDIEKVFYSPRMSNDRKIIASKVRSGENVFVPFAGVGPYAILIAKSCERCKVVGIEKNSTAVFYFRENIRLNRLNNIEVIEGDVLDYVDMYRDWADRIVMPLPKDSYNYLNRLSDVAKDSGILHIYMFVDSRDPIEDGLTKIQSNLSHKFELLETRRLRGYSKTIDEYVFEIRLYKTSGL